MNVALLLLIMLGSLIMLTISFLCDFDYICGIDKSSGLKILSILFVISIIILIISFTLFMIFNFKCITIYEDTPYAIEHIEALKDNNLASGSIKSRRYHSTVYINEDLWYQYVVNLNDGSKVMNKIKANGTKIYYSDEPRVEWYKGKSEWWIFFDDSVPTKQILYISEGSICDDISIDLE